MPLGPGGVGRGSAVHNQALAENGQFEGQGISVRVPGLVPGPDNRQVDERHGRAPLQTNIAGRLQMRQRRGCGGRPRQADPVRIGLELINGRGDAEGGVVEEGYLAVRVRHGRRPPQHSLRHATPLRPGITVREAVAGREVQEVQNVL